MYLGSTQYFGINYMDIYIIYKYANLIHDSCVLQTSRIPSEHRRAQLCTGRGYSKPDNMAKGNLWQGHWDKFYSSETM